MGVGKTARPTWAIVWRDADGADQTALTLPVGRVISLFEPIMHGLQRQVCLALREGYRFRSSRAIDKTSRRYSRSQRYKSDGTGAGYRCRRRSHPKDCGRSSVWRFNALRSAPASERNACGCTCLASFRHSVTKKCHSAAKLLADSASGLLVSHPLRWPGILQQMIDIAFDLFHLGQQFGVGVLLQFQ